MSDGPPRGPAGRPSIRARRLGIDTHAEAIVFLHQESDICRSEGLAGHNRVRVHTDGRSLVATLFQVTDDLIANDEAGLSDVAWTHLGLHEGDEISISHAAPIDSLGLVRGRIYGRELHAKDFDEIIRDIVDGQYSTLDIGAFLTACASRPLLQQEVLALTRSMVDVGERLVWSRSPIVDKHSVGGLPGNRTTPIVVAIVAALGLTMPKTSSRAITSPSGTADTMETLAPIDLSTREIHRVVERENACIVWGGAVRLSPADDILIRVERALDLDTEGQMIASVLSKKIAAGATHLVLDVPVGPTAKVRTPEAAASMTSGLTAVGTFFGIQSRVVISDGRQPVGRGIGPALEAKDVLAVLQGRPGAPRDLRDRALQLAAALVELAGIAPAGNGITLAKAVLDDGRAWRKFERICEAQGGMRVPAVAPHKHPLLAERSGRLTAIDNRRISRLAKLAGAPEDKAAGVELHVQLGADVEAGQILCTVHAESQGELDYALAYAGTNMTMFVLEER